MNVERTDLGNIEYRAKTGEVLRAGTEKLRELFARLVTHDLETCGCFECRADWQAELDEEEAA